MPMLGRRTVLRLVSLGAAAFAAVPSWRGAWAAIIEVPDDPAAAIRSVIGDARPKKGKITLDMPYITETGTSVGITVKVESPMTEQDHVTAVHLFADGNPVPRIASYQLGPTAGKVEISMRVRLARSQRVIGIAKMSDGSHWIDVHEINVAQGACVDDEEGTLSGKSTFP
jgi:sulfur-oxidizing protein SoxY